MSQQNRLNINEYTNFIWKIADLLRGDYKQSEYGDVVLPFTVLCRLDSVLLATKDKVLEIDKTSNFGDKVKEKLFEQATGMKFYNKSNFTFRKLKDDAPNIAENLRDYITSFSANVQEIMEAFNIYAQIERLDKAGLLYMVISKYKIQLINAADFSEKMRKSLGSKRNQITDDQINEIVGIHKNFLPNEYSKIFDNEDFGYWKVTVERPVRYNFSCCEDRVSYLPIVFSKKKTCTWSWSQNDLDGQPMPQELISLKNDLVALGDEVYTDEKQFKTLIAPVVKKHKLTAMQQRTLLYNVLSAEDENGTIYLDAKGNQVANTSLRDYETIPLKTDIQEYFAQEVLPHVPDAWIDESKTKKGYEIPFTRQFYKYVPLRESSVILSEIKALEDKIQADIAGLFE